MTDLRDKSLHRGTDRLLGSAIRRIVLEQSKRAHVGHIGCALSIADIIAAAVTVLGVQNPEDIDRSRLVLSKGQAALALYAALAEIGMLDRGQAHDILWGRQSPRRPS